MIDMVRKALAELLETRRHIDDDIADLQRIIDRHEEADGADAEETATQARAPSGAGRASRRGTGRGQAQREILGLMSDGREWSPAQLAARRGSSANAAGAGLRRLVEQGRVVQVRQGRYKIVSPPGGAQGSLAVEAAREESAPEDREGSVVDEVGRATT